MTAIMTYRQWIAETKRGAFAPRSKALRAIDTVLKEYDKTKSPFDKIELLAKIEDWIKFRGIRWRTHTRNRKHTVSRLYRQVSTSLRDIQYSNLPTSAVFQNDSKTRVRGGRTNSVLTSIDEKLLLYVGTNDDAVKTYLASELYFMADTWLRLDSEENTEINITRYPAVNALYECVVKKLCGIWDCTVNVLPQKLEEIFGRGLTKHGKDIDWGDDEKNMFGSLTGQRGMEFKTSPGHKDSVAKYLKRIEAKKYQLTFENGVAMMYPWWEKKIMNRWEPIRAESKDTHLAAKYASGSGMSSVAMFNTDFCGFVLSMDRRFYVAPHRGCRETENFFHSSYLAGNTVLCAGSIEIRHGIVTGIHNDSGHYHPSEDKLVAALETLRMHGVPQLNNINVHYLYKDAFGDVQLHPSIKASAFLQNQGNPQIIDRMQKQFEERHPTVPRPIKGKGRMGKAGIRMIT
jgi:hypothetical protein